MLRLSIFYCYLQGNSKYKVKDIEQSLSALLMLPEVGMVQTEEDVKEDHDRY